MARPARKHRDEAVETVLVRQPVELAPRGREIVDAALAARPQDHRAVAQPIARRFRCSSRYSRGQRASDTSRCTMVGLSSSRRASSRTPMSPFSASMASRMSSPRSSDCEPERAGRGAEMVRRVPAALFRISVHRCDSCTFAGFLIICQRTSATVAFAFWWSRNCNAASLMTVDAVYLLQLTLNGITLS